MASIYDALIIGGGHNGLVCAFYLAKAGLRTLVLEKRGAVGGACVTEEFHPGFKNSLASYTVSLLQREVIDDLDLYTHGLKIVERTRPNFWPLGTDQGDHLLTSYALNETQAAFARLSEADAAALPDYYETLDRAADILRSLILETPPDHGGGLADWWRAAKIGNRLRGRPLDEQRILFELFTKSADAFLSRWFSHPSIKAAFAFDGVVGNYASPYDPGTAYVLLHHVFGNIGGRSGFWGHAIGGMGAITQAMRAACETQGVEFRTNAPVARVIVESGRAVGVRLAAGEEIRAGQVVSNVNPKLLFTRMIDETAAAPAFLARMKSYACGSATFRMNVALSELPDFLCKPGKNVQDHHGAGIVIGPTMDYLDRAYLDARTQGWSTRPIVEMLIPSVLDATLAPPGRHVASLFCQHFAFDLPGGRRWSEAREAAADAIIDAVTDYAPNFRSAIIARRLLSPQDLEDELGLTGGDIFHGRLSLDQMFSARPQLGAGAYKMPIRNLWLCGSGAHPGGGVTGAPGHNAAREILRAL